MALVVFLADAGPAIGAGHVMRCLALSSAFAEGGWQIGFAANAETYRSVAALSGSRIRCIMLPDSAADEPATLKQQWPQGADVLVVDHYGRDAVFEHACRGWAKRIVVIDDLADRPHEADVVIDAARSEDSYQDFVSASCEVLAGPAYAILHQKFRQARAMLRDCRPRVESIVVSFGQVDASSATTRALAAINAVGFLGRVYVLLGRAAPHLAEVRASVGDRVRLLVDCDDMPRLLAEADLSMGAGGVSAWERCCLGLPTILATIADNQCETVSLIAEAGAAVNVGRPDDLLEQRFVESLTELLHDADRREAMSRAGMALVDGRGAARTMIAAVGAAKELSGRRVNLRLAESADEGWLLDLQRRPETRRYSRSAAAPSVAEHHAWLEKTLAHPGRVLIIVEFDNERAGVLRLDRLGSENLGPVYEISIAVSPELQGRGVGAASLALARHCWPGAVLEATVFPQNTVSAALFQAAGYVLTNNNLYRSLPT